MTTHSISSLLKQLTLEFGQLTLTSEPKEESGAFFRVSGLPVDISVMRAERSGFYSVQITCFDSARATDATWDAYLFDYEGTAQSVLALVPLYDQDPIDWPL